MWDLCSYISFAFHRGDAEIKTCSMYCARKLWHTWKDWAVVSGKALIACSIHIIPIPDDSISATTFWPTCTGESTCFGCSLHIITRLIVVLLYTRPRHHGGRKSSVQFQIHPSGSIWEGLHWHRAVQDTATNSDCCSQTLSNFSHPQLLYTKSQIHATKLSWQIDCHSGTVPKIWWCTSILCRLDECSIRQRSLQTCPRADQHCSPPRSKCGKGLCPSLEVWGFHVQM